MKSPRNILATFNFFLDEKIDNVTDSIIDKNDNNFGKIFIWRDANTDGILNTGEFTALASDASIDLRNITSSKQGPAENSAYILQSAQINLGLLLEVLKIFMR